jgi:hypothetical protein
MKTAATSAALLPDTVIAERRPCDEKPPLIAVYQFEIKGTEPNSGLRGKRPEVVGLTGLRREIGE